MLHIDYPWVIKLQPPPPRRCAMHEGGETTNQLFIVSWSKSEFGFYRTWDRWLAIKPASFCGPLVLSSEILSLLATGELGRVSLRILFQLRADPRAREHCPSITRTYVSLRFNDHWNQNTVKAVVHSIDNSMAISKVNAKTSRYLCHCSICTECFVTCGTHFGSWL